MLVVALDFVVVVVGPGVLEKLAVLLDAEVGLFVESVQAVSVAALGSESVDPGELEKLAVLLDAEVGSIVESGPAVTVVVLEHAEAVLADAVLVSGIFDSD